MAEYQPVLLARVDKPGSHSLASYRADGGYKTFERVLKEMQPAQVTDMVKTSGLRGRGGAGFPTGVKWTFLPKDHPGPIYLCINADESEPCTFNNRILMEKDPHQVLEGAMIACYAIKASTVYYYIRYEYGPAFRATQDAIDELYAAGLLGKNILGSDFSHQIRKYVTRDVLELHGERPARERALALLDGRLRAHEMLEDRLLLYAEDADG